MLTRRELLAAGGLALAGRLLPPPVARLGGLPGASDALGASRAARRGRESDPPRKRDWPTAEVEMWSSEDGARVWFDPVGLRVASGTTVRWIVRRGVHTATAYHPENGFARSRIPPGAHAWDSGYLVEPGATFAVILEVEGVYDYVCRPHEAAGMAGRIVVSPDPGVGSTRRADRPAPAPAPGDGLPEAVRRTLPGVGEILRHGRVRRASSPVGSPPPHRPATPPLPRRGRGPGRG